MKMKMKTRKQKTVIYCRVSTNNQSIDSQLSAIYEYCNKNKIKVDKVIKCESVSAKMNDELLKITELKETLQAGDLLIVKSLDRLGRSIHRIINLVTWLADNGINFTVVDNDTINIRAGKEDLTTKIVVALFGILAELEHQTLVDRIQAGVTLAKKRGVVFGRKKGSRYPSRLDGKEEIVRGARAAGVPKTRIAKDLGTSATNLQHWIKSRGVVTGKKGV